MKTIVPNIDAPDWADRLVSLFPEPWCSEEAKLPGGVLYSLFKAIGDDLERTIDNIEYDRKASRINEAIDVALDSVALDYFGAVAGFPADVIRAPGEPDESLRGRIKASLLLPAATRQSIIDLLTRLTGETPRVMEPWAPGDTACWDLYSFIDVDTPENPSRYGDPGLKFQGFVESTLPSYGGQGDNPVYALDKGSCWDAPSGYLIDPKPTWWLQVARIDALINKTKVYGTTVWRKYRGSPLTKLPLGGTMFLAPGTYMEEVEVFPEFAGMIVVLAEPNWMTNVSYEMLSNSKFRLIFEVPAPAEGGRVDWRAAPITVAGVGLAPVVYESSSVQIGVQSGLQNHGLMFMPNWTTNVWLESRSPSIATLRFSVAAPFSASGSYMFFDPTKSGSYTIPAGSITARIPLAAREPYQGYVLPTWNTSVDVDRNGPNLDLTFEVPPESDSLIFWAVHES